MLCACALVRALNDAKNYAQQGCAMQFDGITLKKVPVVEIHQPKKNRDILTRSLGLMSYP